MKDMIKSKSMWLVIVLVLTVAFICSNEKTVESDNGLVSNYNTKITH
jgi:hypothetical protein